MINLEDIENIYLKLKNTKGGKNADYIPELKKVNPNLYAISIYGIDGYSYNIGDYKKEFGVIDETLKTNLQLWYLHDKGISTQDEIINLMQTL